MARISARRVKTHRSYTFFQLADLLGVTVGTVRRWCKAGLPHVSDARPYLIQGSDFHAFHKAKLSKKKTPLKTFEVYCLGCHAARTPEPGLVEAEPIDAERDCIMAICPTCAGLTRLIISRRDLRKWAGKYGFAYNTREHA
ncbi:helix-turn-helix domain-containing protein [Marivita hallyeonensis]|uniref:Helix-turn-helix domain-containing protein n=1 Tax=Marivita hallyeonensis TaxID=996342 RepID=A0A1M5W0P6_9RHOB|nr:helix-turn-helix domain-containing protein [Marivita hallyeonensis]SHH81041.1 hypothetical protein SAMN05443551_3184 [Marivita hallyeonensis]